MKTRALFHVTLFGFLIAAAGTEAQDKLMPLDPEEAKQIASRLVEQASKIEKPQLTIEADGDQANGWHSPGRAGLMIVPQKDLKEGEELEKKFKEERGAPLAYLFLYRIVPVMDGKAVDPSQLRTIQLVSDQGETHTVYVVLLGVRKPAEDEYRLHGYGNDQKPLINAKFAEGTAAGSQTVTIQVKDADAQTMEGTVVVTVFGKYQASFKARHRPE